MYDYLLAIAAFGFIAFTVVFVHPEPSGVHSVAQHTAVGRTVIAASRNADGISPLLAAFQ